MALSSWDLAATTRKLAEEHEILRRAPLHAAGLMLKSH